MLLVVNCIMTAANQIGSSLAGGQPASTDKLNDLLRTYKELLMPETVEERDAEAKKVKEIMEREAQIGSFQVEPMVFDERNRKGLN